MVVEQTTPLRVTWVDLFRRPRAPWRRALDRHARATLNGASRRMDIGATMPRPSPLFLAALAAPLLAGCVGSSDPDEAAATFSRPLAGNVGGVNGSWTTGSGGYQLVYSIQETEGEAAVCGLYRIFGNDNSRGSRQAIADYQVEVEGTPLVSDLRYFTRVETEEELFATPATCRLTGLPWEDRYLEMEADLTGAKSQYRI